MMGGDARSEYFRVELKELLHCSFVLRALQHGAKFLDDYRRRPCIHAEFGEEIVWIPAGEGARMNRINFFGQ